MSKYIKQENLKWHSPDESIVKPLTEFYVTESDIADLPTIEVSEDCISREWVLSQGKYYYNGKGGQEYAIPIGTIKSAPSVVPQAKEGEIIERADVIKAFNECLETSECGTSLNEEAFLEKINSMPNCGAKMKGVE